VVVWEKENPKVYKSLSGKCSSIPKMTIKGGGRGSPQPIYKEEEYKIEPWGRVPLKEGWERGQLSIRGKVR